MTQDGFGQIMPSDPSMLVSPLDIAMPTDSLKLLDPSFVPLTMLPPGGIPGVPTLLPEEMNHPVSVIPAPRPYAPSPEKMIPGMRIEQLLESPELLERAMSLVEKAKEGYAFWQQIRVMYPSLQRGVFQFGPSMDLWYAEEVESLEELVTLSPSIKTSQMEGLVVWINEIGAMRPWKTSEWVLIVRKTLLYEDVSFPEIELSKRVIDFLKSSLKNAADNSPSTVELLMFLLNESEDALIKKEYDDLTRRETEASTLWGNFQTPIDKLRTELQVFSSGMDEAREILIDLKVRAAKGESISQLQWDSANEQVKNFTEQFTSLSERIKAMEEDRLEMMKQRPDLFPQIAGEHTPVTVELLVNQFIDKYLKANTNIIIRIAYKSLEIGAKAADREMDRLMDEFQAAINETVERFDKFYRAKAEAELQYYEDRINSVLESYNMWAAELGRIQGEMEQLSNTISNNIENRLSGVIGWYTMQTYGEKAFAQESLITDSIATNPYEPLIKEVPIVTQPWFVGVVLKALSSANAYRPLGLSQQVSYPIGLGKWDNHTWVVVPPPKIPSIGDLFKSEEEKKAETTHTEWFWKEDPKVSSSILCARETIAATEKLQKIEGDLDYGWGSKVIGFINDLVKFVDPENPPETLDVKDLDPSCYMFKFLTAYNATLERIQTAEYLQQTLTEFRVSAEEVKIAERQTEIRKRIQQIIAVIAFKMEQLDDLLMDLEMKFLADQGVELPFVEFLDLEEQKPLYKGVVAYLEKTGPQIEAYTQLMNELIPKLLSSNYTEPDVHAFVYLRKIMLQIQAASLIKRRLEDDGRAIRAMKKETENRVLEAEQDGAPTLSLP